MSETPRLLTLQQFAAKHPAFTVGSLRWLRFRTSQTQVTRPSQDGQPSVKVLEPNGFAPAFKSVGGARVLIDEGEFFRIIEEQNASTLAQVAP